MDLTEAEDIKKILRYLHDQDNHDGVITHLEPDILECEGALESITTKLMEVTKLQINYVKS